MKLFNTEEEVNAFLGIEPIGDPDLSWVQPEDRKAVLAVAKLFTAHKAHNQANGFVADWSNPNQWKYNAAHYIEKDTSKPSGLGFAYTYYAYWITRTDVGSRLSVGTETEARHIAKAFEHLYQDLYFI